MWQFENSVECAASRDFTWQFWTNVDNWTGVDPVVESVKLNGSFAAGAKGTTKPRGHDPIEWHLIEVHDRSIALIEIPAPGAILRCLWTFEDSASGGTRITQLLSLEGAQADAYAVKIGPELEKGIPQGMRRLAEEVVRAAGKPRR